MSNRVREERMRRGLSLTKLTVLTSIPSANLSLLERGLCPCYPGWRKRLAAAFNMAESELFGAAE